MSTALRLVRDSDGGDELPPLVAWELFMRGAGRAERTVGDGLQVILEAHRSGDGPAPRKRERSNGISLEGSLSPFRRSLSVLRSRSLACTAVCRYSYLWGPSLSALALAVYLPRPL
jgi:hypothetical protein